jgi:hypothetical protein
MELLRNKTVIAALIAAAAALIGSYTVYYIEHEKWITGVIESIRSMSPPDSTSYIKALCRSGISGADAARIGAAYNVGPPDCPAGWTIAPLLLVLPLLLFVIGLALGWAIRGFTSTKAPAAGP